MYDTNYECRYNRDDIFLETDLVNDDEKNFIRDTLYREDLMNIFDIKDWDNFDLFSHELSELYQKIKNYEPLHPCMKKLSSEFFTEDMETGFFLLYSYHHMYLMHICVSEYLNKSSVSEKNIQLLESLVLK
jgi:hypothetical protein